MSEKKVLQKEVESKTFETKYNSTYKIKDLLEWMYDCETKGATHIDFYGGDDDGDVEEIEISTFYEHEETDEEAKERLEAIKIKKEQLISEERERRRLLYEGLKKEFEQE